MADPIAAFVDDHDASGLSLDDARPISQALDEVTVVDPACGSGAYLVGMMQELVELWTALYSEQLKQDARSLYQLKLHIIERNLYGVDLDPFAVNIAMLRLWLFLAIEYEHDQPEPLPNLDFKILEGDSQLGPDPSESGQQGVLGYDGNRVAELRDLKQRYMTESGPDRKVSLREEIEQAESDLRNQLSHFAGAANALDWRIDVAEVIAEGGFDIAVANPPYIQLQKDPGKLGNLYKPCGFKTFARTGDIYQLFYERGCQLLKAENGLLAYITSNSWLRAEYGEVTRCYFSENHEPIRWLDLDKDVFESAVVDSGVLLLRAGGQAHPFPAVDIDAAAETAFPPPICQWRHINPTVHMPWPILTVAEHSPLENLLQTGTPIGEWDLSINRGVTTGLSEPSIVDDSKRQELLATDPATAQIIKPVRPGRNITRYCASSAGEWLITTFPALELDIEAFPAIGDYLLTFGRERLEQTGARLRDGAKERKKIKHNWFEHQDATAHFEDFSNEKLLWMKMSPEGRFVYSGSGIYCNNLVFVATGRSLKCLCAVLNSRLVTWLMTTTAVTTGMGLIEWVGFSVSHIPVPQLVAAERRPFVAIVDRILDVKTHDPHADTSRWEHTLDHLVYTLYGLNQDEIEAVESRTGTSR